MKPRILLVDDDVLLLRALRRLLQADFEVLTAETGQAGLEALATPGPLAVVLSDFRMPGMDGVQFLDRLGTRSPDTVKIMLTGQAELNTAVEAVNKGHVFRFLTKPIDGQDLLQVLRDAVAQFELITAERTLLEYTLSGSIQALVGLLALFDPTGSGRSQEVRNLAMAIAEALELASSWDIGIAALLSRVGDLAISSEVQGKLLRGERLSHVEHDALLRGPEMGSELIAHIPRLQTVAQMIKYSHKGFNGVGYPRDRVAGAQLPLGARILKVVLDYTDRLRTRGTQATAFAQIELGAGSRYDPTVVAALGQVLRVVQDHNPEGIVALPLDELQPGMVLGDDVVSGAYEAVVLAKGTHLNQLHIEWLRNYSQSQGLTQPVLINRMV